MVVRIVAGITFLLASTELENLDVLHFWPCGIHYGTYYAPLSYLIPKIKNKVA